MIDGTRSLCCSSYQTFDGRKYDYHRDAEVVHYRGSDDKEQMNLIVKTFGRVGYNVGLAWSFRNASSDHRFGWNLLDPMSANPPVFFSSPGSAAGLSTTGASASATIGPYTINRVGTWPNWAITVTLPTKTRVKVTFPIYVGVRHMNTYLDVPLEWSFGKTSGMCGLWDADATNDCRSRDGSQPTGTTACSSSSYTWEVPTSQTLFATAPPAPLPAPAMPEQPVQPTDITTDAAAIQTARTQCSVAAPNNQEACVLDVLIGGAQAVTAAAQVQQEPTPPAVTSKAQVDCLQDSASTLSDWSAWSACSLPCGGGKRSRSRTVTASNGTPCGGMSEEEACNTQACPVNCVLGTWGNWGTCSVTCGPGTQTRVQAIATEAANGGTACPTVQQRTESRACNVRPCPTPQVAQQQQAAIQGLCVSWGDTQ